MGEREKNLTPEEKGFIANHVNELAALSETDFEELKKRAIDFDWAAKQLSQFLHPDYPGNFDLGERISKNVDLVMELIRQANEKRGK